MIHDKFSKFPNCCGAQDQVEAFLRGMPKTLDVDPSEVLGQPLLKGICGTGFKSKTEEDLFSCLQVVQLSLKPYLGI